MYQGVKRRVFVSHYKGDKTEVNAFIERFGLREQVFSYYALGVGNNDDFIDSSDTAYVMKRIRELYLKDSTITIVLMGSCTHSRRYIDWEIKSSLQQGTTIPNGLLGIVLSSQGKWAIPPERFAMNWNNEVLSCYARYMLYPTSGEQLGRWIDDAYIARTTRAALIRNPNEMWKYNRICQIHHQTH
jgi:hypothetical protein